VFNAVFEWIVTFLNLNKHSSSNSLLESHSMYTCIKIQNTHTTFRVLAL